MKFSQLLSTVDYGPILKYLEAFDIVSLNDAIACKNCDLAHKNPDFWDRMKRHCSPLCHYIPLQMHNLNQFIGDMFDSIYLRQCPNTRINGCPYCCPFGPLDTIYNFIVHPTATWNDFLLQPALCLRPNLSLHLSGLGSFSWSHSGKYSMPKSEYMDKKHLRVGDVIILKSGSKLVDAFVVYMRGKHCWEGLSNSNLVALHDSDVSTALGRLHLSNGDERVSQQFPMVMKYLLEGGVWFLGPDEQMYWRHNSNMELYPYECQTLCHYNMDNMNDVFNNFETSLRSYYDFNQHRKPDDDSLSFSDAWKFIQEYVTQAWNFEVFYSDGKFWLRLDEIPAFLRDSWNDSIRPFTSLEEIFSVLNQSYEPEPDLFPEDELELRAFLHDYDIDSDENFVNPHYYHDSVDDYNNDSFVSDQYLTDDSL